MVEEASCTVSFASLTKEELENISIQTIINLLHLKQKRNANNFHKDFRLDIHFHDFLTLTISLPCDIHISISDRPLEVVEQSEGVKECVQLNDEQIQVVRFAPQKFKLLDSGRDGFQALTTYFKNTFSIPVVDISGVLEASASPNYLMQFVVQWMKKTNWTIGTVNMICDEMLSTGSVDHFFNCIQGTVATNLAGMCHINFSTLRLVTPNLRIHNARWVTFQDLLAFDCSKLYLQNTTFTCFDVSQYLNHWCSWDQFKKHENVVIVVNHPASLEDVVAGSARMIEVEKVVTDEKEQYVLRRPKDGSSAKLSSSIEVEKVYFNIEFIDEST